MGEEQATPSEVWVIDTSSVIEVRQKVLRGRQPFVYKKLTEMVDSDTLVFPVQVLQELERNAGNKRKEDLPLSWARRNKARGCCDPDYALVVEVLSEVGQVLDPQKPSGQDEADPYVLALALAAHRLGHRPTVITEERNDKPEKMSMSTACGFLHLPCVPIMPLLERRGIWKPPPR